MKFLNILVLFLYFICRPATAQPESKISALQIIDKSINAMGGESLLSSIESIRFKGQGYQNALEQSERYEGPYIPLFRKFDCALDFSQNKMWYALSSTFPKSPSISMNVVVDSGTVGIKRRGAYFPHFYQEPTIKDELDFSIVKILIEAKKASNIKCLTDTTIDLSLNNVIQFYKSGHNVKIFINSLTNLITAIELRKPYDENFLSVWGDSKKFTYFSFWELYENGIHFPLQQDVWINNKHYQTSLIDELSFNSIKLDSISLPEVVRNQARNLSSVYLKQYADMMTGAKEIAKDVWMIPGPCNATLINEGKELILIEAPLSSTYSAELIKKVKSIYPDKILSTVISTSDAWLHLGGLREFAASGTKIIALKENSKIINDLLASNYTSTPDSFEKSKRSTKIIEISKGETLKGNIEMKIIPIRSEAGDRMLMVYFPKYKLLYGSDLFQPKMPNGKYFVTHYIYEICKAIEREKIEVENIYGMHTDLIKYSDVKQYIENIIGLIK